MSRLFRDLRFKICGGFIALIVITAIFAPFLAPMRPEQMNASSRLQAPGSPFALGTDEFGRDILSRLMYGARLSLLVSVASVTIATVIGSLLGLVAGFHGGLVELGLMRVVDAILSFPSMLLALLVVTFIGPELQNVILTIGVLYIPRFARVMHGATLTTRENAYVEAAEALGTSSWRIMFRTILPNVMAPIMVQVSLSMGNAMLLESSLSFLGMGPPPPATAWGRMISESAPFMRLSAYGVIWPALAISLTILAFNILGDSLRDALDPRLKGVQ